jgi:hypothetical protein
MEYVVSISNQLSASLAQHRPLCDLLGGAFICRLRAFFQECCAIEELFAVQEVTGMQSRFLAKLLEESIGMMGCIKPFAISCS